VISKFTSTERDFVARGLTNCRIYHDISITHMNVVFSSTSIPIYIYIIRQGNYYVVTFGGWKTGPIWLPQIQNDWAS